MSDYWWDRSGRDLDLERVEELLSPLAFAGRPLVEPPTVRRFRLVTALAVGAALALGWLLWSVPSSTTWDIYPLAGAPTVEGAPVVGVGRWRPGQTLETGREVRAKILVGRVGEVDLEPNSRLRLVGTGAKDQRLALERGSLRAFVWAPPRRFFIETKEATAVDLGCAYSLDVESSGAGRLRVAFGWVSFVTADREVYVPAGGACALHPGRGPGTPYYEDASEHFREALARVDGAGGGGLELSTLLAEARPKDAFSLLQLLPRLGPPERESVYDRLTALVPPPPDADRSSILRGDHAALSRYWAALGVGELKWWRLGGDLPGPPNRPAR